MITSAYKAGTQSTLYFPYLCPEEELQILVKPEKLLAYSEVLSSIKGKMSVECQRMEVT